MAMLLFGNPSRLVVEDFPLTALFLSADFLASGRRGTSRIGMLRDDSWVFLGSPDHGLKWPSVLKSVV